MIGPKGWISTVILGSPGLRYQKKPGGSGREAAPVLDEPDDTGGYHPVQGLFSSPYMVPIRPRSNASSAHAALAISTLAHQNRRRAAAITVYPTSPKHVRTKRPLASCPSQRESGIALR